jgi:hypothetical protein
VENSYATGDVIATYPGNTAYYGTASAGGLIGCSSSASMVNSYATGNIKAASTSTDTDSYFGAVARAGGLVGNVGADVVVESCYCLSTQKIIGDTINDAGKPLTSVEMKNNESFIGWDFKIIWGIKSNVNNGYPYLMMKLPVEPTSTESTPAVEGGLFGSYWFIIVLVIVVLVITAVVYVFLKKRLKTMV